MARNINSAFRIREILNSVKAKADQTPIHQIWSEIFDFSEKDQTKRNVSISRCLANLHDEVELVRREMLKLDYTPTLYEPSLNRCNIIFAVQSIMGQWKNIKKNITPDVVLALGFCSEILPNEEDLIEQSDLDELSKLANDLRESLVESTLPPYTQGIIEKHLSKIEEAIYFYKAVGAKALDEVIQSAYGEMITNEAAFEEAIGSKELGKLSNLWQKTKSLLDGVVSANKRIGAAQGMAGKGQRLLEFIQNLTE